MTMMDQVVGEVPGRLRVEARQAQLMRRARFLGEVDRTMVELAFVRRMPARKMAVLLGVSCSTVTRRLRRLAVRLDDPVVVALVEHGGALPVRERAWGLQHFLCAVPVKRLAEDARVSRAQVYEGLAYVRGWAKGRGR